MLPPMQPNDPNWPTCGIVIEKDGEHEVICPNPASQMVNLANPDNHSQIYAVVLVCDKHDEDLENGKALIAAADNGDRIGISYKQKEEDRDATKQTDGGNGGATGSSRPQARSGDE
jgi:hypothetical protein